MNETKQSQIVLQSSAIGAFLAKEAKQLAAKGNLKSINSIFALPLSKVNKLNLSTPFLAFSKKFHLVCNRTFTNIRNLTIRTKTDLPSELVIFAAINAGILLNDNTKTYSEAYNIARNLSYLFSLNNEDEDCFLFIELLINLLLDEGYFRQKHVQILLNLGIGSKELHQAIDYIFLHSKDRIFITRALLDPSIIKHLSFNEIIIVKAIFYLLQTFEIRDSSRLPGRKPKFLASNLISISDTYIDDVIILYSALYAASDHYVTLYRKPFYLALDAQDDEIRV